MRRLTAFLGFTITCALCPGAGQTTAPESRQGFGMPDWFVNAARADEFRESSLQFTAPQPLESARLRESPFATESPSRQPVGALTGKVVFAMAGHGWTYSYETGIWYTQRGVTHGVVEDLGNSDQMRLFVRYLWNAGGTVVPFRPVDYQPVERVVDNSNPLAEFYGPWSSSKSPVFYGTLLDREPYKVAVAETTVTAIARFRPFLPTAGFYPVYCWARDGADRVDQTYRVAHSGGITEVRVDHRRVGKGWVWLGTHYFNRGRGGYVEITNFVADPYQADGRHVVVADAVRFGNGMGDVNRGGGISGYPRDEEGDCYWIERSLGHTADPRLFTVSGDDGAATVGSPPKAAAFMNREAVGGFFDRVLVSYHSNALSGKARGTVGLFNASPAQRPSYQEELARQLGSSLEDTMVSASSVGKPVFSRRARVTYNGINFGEQRKDYLQNELCASILEVAFHDNVEDARILLNPASRLDMARATLRGLLRWFEQVDPNARGMELLPASPRQVAAVSLPNGPVRISWRPGPADTFRGESARGYRIALSRNGLAFGAGQTVGDVTMFDMDGLTTAGATYLRVTAFNAGGESMPSETVAVRPTVPPSADPVTTPVRGRKLRPVPSPKPRKTLIVQAYTSMDPTLNIVQSAEAGLGSGRGPGGRYQRVRPEHTNSANYCREAAQALVENGQKFDTASAAAVLAGTVRLADYEAVIWLAGRQSPEDGILTSGTQRLIREYAGRGGKMFLSGARIAEELDRPSTGTVPSRTDRRFLREVLGCAYAGSTSATRGITALADAPLSGVRSLQITDGTGDIYDPLPADVLAPARGSGAISLAAYDYSSTAVVCLGRRTGVSGGIVTLSVPFETIVGETDRAGLLRGVMDFLDGKNPPASPVRARKR